MRFNYDNWLEAPYHREEEPEEECYGYETYDEFYDYLNVWEED